MGWFHGGGREGDGILEELLKTLHFLQISLECYLHIVLSLNAPG